MKIIDCEQGSEAWHSARCGRVTASKVADIMRQTKSGPSAMRATYMGNLIAERLSGCQEEGYTSPAMQHGKDTEDEARTMYAFQRAVKIQKVGLIIHPTIDMFAASTDSLAGDDGMLEIKCPETKTHIKTLLGEPIDPDHIKQMQAGMACSGRLWCDYISYDPRLPPRMRMSVTRVHRDHAAILQMEIAVRAFLRELDEQIAELNERFAEAA